MNYNEAVEYIYNIPRFSNGANGLNKSGSENLLAVMNKLGNPHLRHKAIHIAGTNGKGSTVQFIRCLLNAKGYKVGCFVSPHLVKINERISIWGDMKESDYGFDPDISDDDFLICFNKVFKAIDDNLSDGGTRLSFFEFVFAMAAVYFQDKMLDYVIYETGLGGRLDATNILQPVITGITSIGLDHTKYLGNTIKEVAYEKAGIIKTGVPVVYNTGDIEADAVIRESALSVGAKEINVAKTEYIIFDLTDKIIDFSLSNSYYRYDNIKLKVTGATYQIDNAITAIVLCNALGMDLDKDAIQRAVDGFSWPGRMEQIHPNIILDGAHNMDAIERFVEACDVSSGDNDPILLFAVAEDKDYEPMIEYLCRELSFKHIIVTSINSDRSVPADYVAAIFRLHLKKKSGDTQCTVTSNDNISLAFNKGFNMAKAEDRILFCIGSLYLIGSIKEIAKEVI